MVSSDKFGRLEQPLPFPPICDLYSLEFSFPVQHKSGDLRLFNNICQVTTSFFQGDSANSQTSQICWSCLMPNACPSFLYLLRAHSTPAACRRGTVSLKNLMPAFFQTYASCPRWRRAALSQGRVHHSRREETRISEGKLLNRRA